MITFLRCRDHGGLHRAIQRGALVVPRAVCHRRSACEFKVNERLPRIDRPRQVCPACFPGFHNITAAVWEGEA